MKRYVPMIFLFLFFTLFVLKGVTILDPDFGWHLKMGEIIIGSGIPRTDPFSYTMPSYPFVDHEWLTNVAIRLLFSRIGMMGFAILFAAIATATMALVFYRKASWWNMLYAAMMFCILFPFAGVRPQLLSWFLVAVYLLVLTLRKKIWLVVPLMVLWVNLHGGFFVGVGMVGVYALAAVCEKKDQRRALALLCLTFLATFINPYRERIWWEVFMQLSDSSLRFFISEWMPSLFFLNLTYWLYAVFAAVVVAKFRRHIPLFSRVLFWIFFVAGLSSMRNIPLWVFVSAYPVTLGLAAFLKEARRTSERRNRLRFVLVRLQVVVVVVIVLQLIILLSGSVTTIQYPEKAVAYIKQNNLSGRMLAAYGWGGYLIWKLPDHKVFIDGRMPSWRWEGAPPGESANARQDYNRFFENKTLMKKIGEKYRVSYILIQSPPKPTAWEQWIRQIFSLKANRRSPVFDLPAIYDDGVATIRVLEQP